MITNNFIKRHNGPTEEQIKQMLNVVGASSLDDLMNQTIPDNIRLPKPLNLPKGLNEFEYMNHISELAEKNQTFKSFIGQGYYDTITPGVIMRNIFENPGWYTSYTPYQAEISQGRLEALLIFQTVVSDLTGLPIANASLLDEGTSAAEAMIMLYNTAPKNKNGEKPNTLLVSKNTFIQTIDVLNTRAHRLGINVKLVDDNNFNFTDDVFAILVQYPDKNGNINNYKALCEEAQKNNVKVIVAADILSLALLTPPGEWGADVVVGSTQRLGIPMGFGGPHAGYFATKDDYKRNIPGRIIGVTIDKKGNKALRMALQTREQHIKRERATSNICTAQALLATMAGMYAVYHGADGIKEIARHINILTGVLAQEIAKYGYKQINTDFFDTLLIQIPDNVKIDDIRKMALDKKMNLHYVDEKHINISLGETACLDDINTLLEIFAKAANKEFTKFVCNPEVCKLIKTFDEGFNRKSPYLTDSVFNDYHSETGMMRYLKKLENRDLALNRSMIPLGSCTMKLNAAVEMMPLSFSKFTNVHPFAPTDQVQGYLELISNLERDLCEITGFDSMSFQPNSGASGEYTGLLVIRAYLDSINQGHRNICLIPSSAHGTNPASAVMAGMTTVTVKSDENGNIDIEDLKLKAEKHKDNLGAIMVTYPSTHGVYEEGIRKIVDIVHENGGQVYMDGANMNAQVGFTNPGYIGADVCHLNLHKTFAIPHGGGGPGVGPIGVAKHLTPFLPGHSITKIGTDKSISAVSSAAFGSAYVLPITYGYIKLLGQEGLEKATQLATLNANYLKKRLEGHYKILYTGKNDRVAHEFIIDCNQFLKTANITASDIAKRLMDYGFHAPTVAFPVIGTLMIEPTESEPLSELDKFAEALIDIRKDIADIESGKCDKNDNIIKDAPFTIEMATADDWDKPYSRQKALFPLNCGKVDKYFPAVTRVDDAYGDRNLMPVYSDFVSKD